MSRSSGYAQAWVIAVPVLALALGDYRGGLFIQYALLGAATSLLAFAWGTAGILSLGQSVFFGIGAYVTGWFSLHYIAAGSVLGLAVGMALAGGVSLLVALVGTYPRFDAITFALLTFVCALAAVPIINQWTSVTGGFNGLNQIPSLHLGGPSLTRGGQRVLIGAIVAGVLYATSSVARSPLGGALKLVRDNPTRAASLGFNVPLLRVATFTAVGALTGLMGGLYATQLQQVSSDAADLTLATTMVVWAMLGSRTTTVGPFIAVLALSFLANEIANTSPERFLLAVGLAFVVAVMFLPEGAATWIGRCSRRHAGTTDAVVAPELPPDRDGTSDDALAIRDVSCTFGRFKAVSDVDLTLSTTGVHCLIGPNGAGKSTLLNVLSGVTRASAGTWGFARLDLTNRRPWVMARAGILRKFQAPAVAPSLTVGQNMVLAVIADRRSLAAIHRSPWQAGITSESLDVLKLGGLDAATGTLASTLSHGKRQLLELAMVLARPSRVLLLDEPTAGMTHDETAAVGKLLEGLAVTPGRSIVMVEHDLGLIRAVARRISVLRDGFLIADGTLAEIEADEAVREAYLDEKH